jgi:DNA polymerase V
VVGVRVLRELRGERSISVSSGAVAKQHIASTRSFGRPVNKLSELTEAISVYTERALQKMEHQQSACRTVGVFLSTDRFKKEKGYYAKSAYGTLSHATCNPHEIIQKAVELIGNIYLPQFSYVKAGVFLASFEDVGSRQLSLFEEDVFETAGQSKSEKLATLLATSEKKFGKKQIAMASSGINPTWQMRMAYRSPHYTTDWNDLPVISPPKK